MAGITMKSTKQEIMEAYKEAVERLDERDKMIDDPAKEAEKAKKVEVIASADKTAKEDIFNPEIIKKYNDLTEAITMKQLELEELYGIEAKANAMAAMINAYKEKTEELKESHAMKTAEMESELSDKKTVLENEIKTLVQQKQEVMDSINAEAKAKMDEINLIRIREKDEYEYNLKRNRKTENDKWEDEKAAREKALAEREAAVRADENELAEKTAYIEELEKKVEEIPELLQNAKDEAFANGKEKADRSNAFEVRALKQQNEYDIKLFEDRINRLTEDNEQLKMEKADLQCKLDDAYAQMRDLAAETVKSTGGVKILSGQNSQVNK